MKNAINYGIIYSENSLEHLARQTARRYCEKQYQHSGLLMFKTLADELSRSNALYKDNGETVKTSRKVETGETTQSIDMDTTKALENASIDYTLASDFVSACFTAMLSAYRQLEQFAERNKILLTAEQVRLYLIKQGVKNGCYVINKQEFPRHRAEKNAEKTFIYITDISEQAHSLIAGDEYEPIFDTAVLNDLDSVLNEREQIIIKEHYIFGDSYTAIAERHNTDFSSRYAVEKIAQRTIKKMQEYAKANKITA